MTVTPTPRHLYVHDDLTEIALGASAQAPDAPQLAATLFATMRQEPHVVVLSLAEQIDAVLRSGGYPPFATAIGIGAAGERVAHELHHRAGWFPRITRIQIRREEGADGEYTLTGPAPLAQQLEGLASEGPIAIVDDTIFSGLTLRAVLTALPSATRARTRAFCLRAVAESLPAIEALCPVTVGFAAAGRILEDVSFINASGLVRRGAIRRVGAPALAFFERAEWMHAWFPRRADEVTRLCGRLHALLDQAAGASLDVARAV